jgi:hypothetical protein
MQMLYLHLAAMSARCIFWTFKWINVIWSINSHCKSISQSKKSHFTFSNRTFGNKNADFSNLKQKTQIWNKQSSAVSTESIIGYQKPEKFHIVFTVYGVWHEGSSYEYMQTCQFNISEFNPLSHFIINYPYILRPVNLNTHEATQVTSVIKKVGKVTVNIFSWWLNEYMPLKMT